MSVAIGQTPVLAFDPSVLLGTNVSTMIMRLMPPAQKL